MPPTADVLIVTATAVESRAVLAACASRSGQPARPIPLGDRVYHDLGSVDGRRAWLALCEMGAAGVGGALQSVQKAIATLSPAAVILAGIAFGVDERKQQIGDLLVSRQLFLYEPQRVGMSQPRMNQPGVDQPGVDQVIVRGDRPHASALLIDALRNAELHWPQDGATVRFGLLLSGEKLVDSTALRRRLLQLAPEVIGGEMEGAGLYVACADTKVDWIVVKAICDFADGNKAVDKDARQAIAARNAAAFVAHAVSFIPAVGGRHQGWTAPKPAPAVGNPDPNPGEDGGDRNRSHGNPPQRSERQRLHECIDKAFASEDELRTFCFEHFEPFYRNLRELDRRPYITRELIGHVTARAATEVLWRLLQARHPECARTDGESR